ncbi:alpha/beta hydrolase [Streptomyces sp. NPDC029554]|uniref:alpha/beta fold hydrolase n=1 Tax=Streptomyces sp. NPDC029554 TaxID=3155126 RepID=UPI0033C0DF00
MGRRAPAARLLAGVSPVGVTTEGHTSERRVTVRDRPLRWRGAHSPACPLDSSHRPLRVPPPDRQGNSRRHRHPDRPPRPATQPALLPHARRGSRRAITEFARAVPRGPADPARRLLAPPEESDDLARLPMLIGWGTRDPVFSAEVLTEWTRRHPHAVVHRFPRAGHLVMDDAGAELGLRIRDFLLPEPVRGLR